MAQGSNEAELKKLFNVFEKTVDFLKRDKLENIIKICQAIDKYKIAIEIPSYIQKILDFINK